MLRSIETQKKYKEHIKNGGLKECPLCTKSSIKDFEYFRVVKNKFPYDIIAEKNDMLILKRHSGELSPEEEEEMKELKKGYLNKNYDYMIEAFPDEKSIPGHFHIHLIVSKGKF